MVAYTTTFPIFPNPPTGQKRMKIKRHLTDRYYYIPSSVDLWYSVVFRREDETTWFYPGLDTNQHYHKWLAYLARQFRSRGLLRPPWTESSEEKEQQQFQQFQHERVVCRTTKQRARGIERVEVRDRPERDGEDLARDMGERMPCDLWREKEEPIRRAVFGGGGADENDEEGVRFEEGERAEWFRLDMVDRGEGMYTIRSAKSKTGKKKKRKVVPVTAESMQEREEEEEVLRRGAQTGQPDGDGEKHLAYLFEFPDTEEGSEGWMPIRLEEYLTDQDEIESSSLSGSWLVLKG